LFFINIEFSKCKFNNLEKFYFFIAVGIPTTDETPTLSIADFFATFSTKLLTPLILSINASIA
tara:strand:+ start:381 stop:569 length:189 start_codon:yes stop_codon:yes gene_type:complete